MSRREHSERCETIRPLVYRDLENEASPVEAMRVARHLSDCTTCRIVIARERRLARLLAEDLRDVPVGEEFVGAVMASLPKGPPPAAPRRNRQPGKRRLRLADAS